MRYYVEWNFQCERHNGYLRYRIEDPRASGLILRIADLIGQAVDHLTAAQQAKVAAVPTDLNTPLQSPGAWAGTTSPRAPSRDASANTPGRPLRLSHGRSVSTGHDPRRAPEMGGAGIDPAPSGRGLSSRDRAASRQGGCRSAEAAAAGCPAAGWRHPEDPPRPWDSPKRRERPHPAGIGGPSRIAQGALKHHRFVHTGGELRRLGSVEGDWARAGPRAAKDKRFRSGSSQRRLPECLRQIARRRPSRRGREWHPRRLRGWRRSVARSPEFRGTSLREVGDRIPRRPRGRPLQGRW